MLSSSSTGGSIAIRPARVEDARPICHFLADLEEEEFDFSVFSKLYEQAINKVDNIYLVAVDGASVIGYLSCHGQILLHHLGKVFEIQELYVDPVYRNRNIGKLLLSSLEEILKTTAYTSLEVTSNKKRTKAHHFYTSCGFEQSHLKFTKKNS